MKKTFLFACACAALAVGRAGAEEVVFFQSSTSGSKAWSWSSARVSERADGAVAITESSPTNTAGDAYVTDFFPYVPSGRVLFDVAEVARGDYTLQVLAFRNFVHFQTVTVVNHDSNPGRHEFSMRTLNLPEKTQSVLFKVWVAGADGASVEVRELRYSDEIDSATAILDDRFTDASAWLPEANRVTFFPAAEGPATLALVPPATYGSLASAVGFNIDLANEMLFYVPKAEKGAVGTLQIDVFDKAGVFLEAIDLVKDVPAGHHVASLGAVKWPDGAARFHPKIWISCKDSAGSLSLSRLLIHRR
jgi:hypothetical protein